MEIILVKLGQLARQVLAVTNKGVVTCLLGHVFGSL
jgi:hypothetical protein